MAKEETLRAWVQDAIDKGATSTEEIHRSIANLPLDVLERAGILEKSAAKARRIQDATIGSLYDVIRNVNQQVGELADELLGERESKKGGSPEG
jgi:hypothetical protein